MFHSVVIRMCPPNSITKSRVAPSCTVALIRPIATPPPLSVESDAVTTTIHLPGSTVVFQDKVPFS